MKGAKRRKRPSVPQRMNLLITGAWSEAKEHIEEIRSMGHEVCFLQQEKDDLPCDPDWAEGIICNGFFLYHPIESFSNLRYIQLTSAGYDRVPMNYIQSHRIEIQNARGVYSIPMAEFAVAGVLSMYKDLGAFRDQQQRHEWQKRRNLRELAGSRVLIVGCGSVGTECAKRFKAFGCTVHGIDVTPFSNENYETIRPLEALDSELLRTDILILTVPLTEVTRHLINQQRLARFHGILVNISRGAVIDQKALEIWDGSAVLDVFEDEPLSSDSHLWDKCNTIITPHNSFVGSGNGKRLSALIMKNLKGNVL